MINKKHYLIYILIAILAIIIIITYKNQENLDSGSHVYSLEAIQNVSA